MKRIIMLLAIAVFYVFPAVSYAYKVIEVKNGGNIEGTVEFAGKTIPKDETLAVTSDTAYCGKSLPAEKYVINAERRIKNAVVFIEDIESGKAIPDEAATVTNLKCMFVPHVVVGFKGNRFVMKNDDPILHTFDVHASLGGREINHFAFYEKGLSVTKTLPKPGLLKISCYIHPWQRSYVYVFDHPYAAVTDENGEFSIKDIPPGVYTIEAWHEALGKISMPDIKVVGGETSRIKIQYNLDINNQKGRK